MNHEPFAEPLVEEMISENILTIVWLSLEKAGLTFDPANHFACLILIMLPGLSAKITKLSFSFKKVREAAKNIPRGGSRSILRPSAAKYWPPLVSLQRSHTPPKTGLKALDPP